VSHEILLRFRDHYERRFVYLLDLFADGNDFSWETIQKNRNIYYQKELANEIMNQINQIISLLTLSLNIQLNIGQELIINTSDVFLSLEAIKINSLSNKQIGNAQISIPIYFNSSLAKNTTVLIRVCYLFLIQLLKFVL
jgi:hypothetical protein